MASELVRAALRPGVAALVEAQHDVTRRVNRSHTPDGFVRAERLRGLVPSGNIPALGADMVAAPDGTDFDDIATLLADLSVWASKTPPSGAVVGDTDTQTLTNKTLQGPAVTGSGVDITSDGTSALRVRSTGLVTRINVNGNTGALTFNGSATLGNSDNDATVIQGHDVHKSAAPSISVGAALGSGGSVAASILFGTDQYGKLRLTAGTTGLGTGTAATVTFATARPDANYTVHLEPASSNARINAVQKGPSSLATGSWLVTFTVAPSSGLTYDYFYAIKETTN